MQIRRKRDIGMGHVWNVTDKESKLIDLDIQPVSDRCFRKQTFVES